MIGLANDSVSEKESREVDDERMCRSQLATWDPPATAGQMLRDKRRVGEKRGDWGKSWQIKNSSSTVLPAVCGSGRSLKRHSCLSTTSARPTTFGTVLGGALGNVPHAGQD